MANYDDGLDAVAGALAHRGRRQAIARLAARPATSSELAAELDVRLPTLMRHLGVLGEAGLVTSTKQGRTVTHRLRVEPLGELDAWIALRRSFWDHQLDALADGLAGGLAGGFAGGSAEGLGS